jgi:uncharacterized membrane-anchored protein
VGEVSSTPSQDAFRSQLARSGLMTYELSDTPEAARDANGPGRHPHRLRLNKVPEITLYFWVIKVLCTTVGETAADLLNEKAGLGLTGVSVLMSALLAVVLVVQFRTAAYRAGVYWLAVALISVVGTLSIHSIDTTSREAFYWLAVLFTFALGTAAGDLVSERMNLGYWLSAVLFALAIAAVGIAHFALGLDAVWSFWIAYILTRPLGASIGDYLSQPTGDGGLGLGTVVTSVLFLAVILGRVVFLTVTRKDVIDREPAAGQVA